MGKEKNSFKLPHVYIIMSCVMLFVTILTFIVPSGELGRMEDPETGREVVIPGDYTRIDDVENITPMDFFKSIHLGLVNSVDIIMMLLLAAGAIYIVDESGTITAGIQSLLKVSEGKEYFIIATLLLMFSVLGAAGISEETIPMLPLIVSVVVGMGFDKYVGAAIVLMGVSTGFSSGVINVYSTGVAQGVVGLPLFSGIGFRAIAWVIFNAITIAYICNYAKKIKEDPSKSFAAGEELNDEVKKVNQEEIEFTLTRKIVLFSMIGIFVFQAYGAIKLDWDLSDISALYIMFAVFATILLRINPSEACVQFATGASQLLPAALTMGFARAIMVIMDQAMIIDTAVYWLSGILQGRSTIITLLLIYLSIIIFNFFVLSGSGKAVILMPILEPLGELVGINQQVMVLLFNYGDGFTNQVWPTASTLMASLGMAGIEWTDWIKFTWKLFLMLIITAFILIVFAHYINLGPF